ncbi:MAG: CPBP family intramembrane metalloprotease [Clostridium sp.]|nr:CPBP family intramembrane metalloprotease [Clostridium sp.]
MNGKKANWAFLLEVIGYIGMVYAIMLFFPRIMDSLILDNLVCELVLMLPVLIFSAASGEKPGSFLEFHKIKISSALMTVLFTFLSMPVLTLFNLISQLWVQNEVAAAMEEMQVSEMPFWEMFLSMAVIAPLFEEIACRGAYYRAYRKSGSVLRAMLMSSVIFAASHMNFNQAAYAFVVGILAVLLVEATGSLWTSILYHGVINGSQSFLMYQMLKINPNIYSEQADTITGDIMIYGIGAYLLITAATLPLAWAVLVWISGNEGRRGVLGQIWRDRKEKKDKIITAPFLLALILALGMMTAAIPRLVTQIYQYFLQYPG